MAKTAEKYTEQQIDDYCQRVEENERDINAPCLLASKSVEIIKQLQDENEQLKDVIILEADTMVAHAVFDDLGNDARFVKRLFLTVGDIIPELKALADEVELTLRAGG